MTTEYLDGGVAYRAEACYVFITNDPHGQVTIPEPALKYPLGTIFSFESVRLISFKGSNGEGTSTAYLLNTKPIEVEQLIGVVRRYYQDTIQINIHGYRGFIVYMKVNDLPQELKEQNLEGKAVIFKNMKADGGYIYTTKIQLHSTFFNDNGYFAMVDFLDPDSNQVFLMVFVNDKQVGVFSENTKNLDLVEEQIVFVKLDINIDTYVVTDIQTIGRRKGKLENYEYNFNYIVDESNNTIKYRSDPTYIEPDSLSKMANGKTVSYEVKYYHYSIIPYNIRVENE